MLSTVATERISARALMLLGLLVVLSVTCIAGPATSASAVRAAATVTQDQPAAGGSTIIVPGDCRPSCGGEIVVPGETGDTIGANPGTGLSPGPDKCIAIGLDNIEHDVPCTSADFGWWSNYDGCYYKLSAQQPETTPPGKSEFGALYQCANYCYAIAGFVGPCVLTNVWLNTAPPGVDTLTPGQAVARALASFELEGISIGITPDSLTSGARAFVGVPVWMWVDNPQPLTFGPYDINLTLGGVFLTMRAEVGSVQWDMGDGSIVNCSGTGTVYSAGLGFTDSPTCGHRYATASTGSGDGRFPITATSQWTVSWNANGVVGSQTVTRASTTSLEVRELQSVNVGN
ncbi:MAG: hypothetical protein JWQ43_130 [Glaciihabitans sp.]|nr:hypothetical protein [Glaciihabitans sp.]